MNGEGSGAGSMVREGLDEREEPGFGEKKAARRRDGKRFCSFAACHRHVSKFEGRRGSQTMTLGTSE
jgi:hypothetical protein